MKPAFYLYKLDVSIKLTPKQVLILSVGILMGGNNVKLITLLDMIVQNP